MILDPEEEKTLAQIGASLDVLRRQVANPRACAEHVDEAASALETDVRYFRALVRHRGVP